MLLIGQWKAPAMAAVTELRFWVNWPWFENYAGAPGLDFQSLWFSFGLLLCLKRHNEGRVTHTWPTEGRGKLQ